MMKRAFWQFGALDARLIGRDSLLRGMVLLPLGVALAIRFVLPLVLMRLAAALAFDPGQAYTTVASAALILITPTLYGMVIGFLLLDQRDERTLLALQVTPLGLGGYLTYRLVPAALFTIPVTLIGCLIAGVGQLAATLLAALSAAPLTALVALALIAFARNKVEGLALTKALSVFLILPLGSTLVPAPWGWLLGALPTFWPLQVFWFAELGQAGAWLALGLGWGYCALLGAWLWRRAHSSRG